jgi:hypothetical protein
MGIINYVIYSLVINSNLYLKGISTNLSYLDKMIESFSDIYPIYFNENDAVKQNLTSKWFSYLDSINCKKVLLISENYDNSIEVVKENGYSDLWFFDGKSTDQKYSYFLTKNLKQIKSSKYELNVEYNAYLSKTKEYLSELDNLMTDENSKKVSSYFEDILKVFSIEEIGGRNIPTYGLIPEIQILLSVYEKSGDFKNYRGWNPFRLGEEKEKRLNNLYDEYKIFRGKMLTDVINSI